MKFKQESLIHVLALLLLTGCNRPVDDPAVGVKAVVESTQELPDFLAGRWTADQHGWELVFERDGHISSAVVSLGRVRIVPGRTTTMPTRGGSEAVFTPGPWLVHYESDTRVLTVKITLDHVRLEMAGNILEGSSTDVFAGPISPAGDTWQAQWTTFTHYTAHTPESTSFDLSTDPVYGETKPLVFQKTTGPQP
jgi:hypothetical protein